MLLRPLTNGAPWYVQEVSSSLSLVDLAGGLSKLAPPAIQMVRVHQSIRARRHRTHRRRHHPQQAPQASEDLLQRAETAYAAGGSLKSVARQVGLGHERLSRLLRERGVILRNHSPSSSETRLMDSNPGPDRLAVGPRASSRRSRAAKLTHSAHAEGSCPGSRAAQVREA